MNQKALERMADAEDEAIAATGGLLACSPEIMQQMELERDAARYRWIRTHSWLEGRDAIHFGPGANQVKPEILDESIDDAMRYPILGESDAQ